MTPFRYQSTTWLSLHIISSLPHYNQGVKCKQTIDWIIYVLLLDIGGRMKGDFKLLAVLPYNFNSESGVKSFRRSQNFIFNAL